MKTSSFGRIYLAGPTAFYKDALHIFARMKAICNEEGIEGVAPINGQLSLQGIEPGRALYKKVVEADFNLIDECDGAIVCLDPFHGMIEMDAGTAVEIGYLHARRKPMSGWSTETRTFGDRIRGEGETPTPMSSDSGATSCLEQDGNGMLAHSAELVQHGLIELSGGSVSVFVEWEAAFRAAAREMAQRFPELVSDVPLADIDFDSVPLKSAMDPEQHRVAGLFFKDIITDLVRRASEREPDDLSPQAPIRIEYLCAVNVWRNAGSLLTPRASPIGNEIVEDAYDYLAAAEAALVPGLQRILKRDGIDVVKYDRYLATSLRNWIYRLQSVKLV